MTRQEIILLERQLRERIDEMERMNTALVNTETGDVRGFTDDERNRFDDLSRQSATLREILERAQNLGEFSFTGGENGGPQTDDERGGQPQGYEQLGAMIRDIANYRLSGGAMPEELRDMMAGNGESGGFLVPKQHASTLMMVEPERAIVRPRATVIPAGDAPDAEYEIPALNQATSITGGVVIYWTKEGAAVQKTDGDLRTIDLRSHEMTAYIPLTNKLLNNAPVAEAFVRNLLRRAMVLKEEQAFLTGDGVGKPLGVVGSAAVKVIDRATSSQFNYADIGNMLAGANLEGLQNYVWIVNQTVFPQIFGMEDTNGNSIYIQGDITKGIVPTLGGVPVMFSGRNPVLGTKGDVMLLDLSNYLIKDGSGPFIDVSEHVLFLSNKTAVKLTWNVDGQSWLNAPIPLEDGSTTVSPFVVLE